MLNPAVTQQTIGSTICVSGYTKTIRPPPSYTTSLKVAQIASYGDSDTNTANYEEDHVESGVEQLTGYVLAGQIVSDASVEACPS